jgi:hypothetical protein
MAAGRMEIGWLFCVLSDKIICRHSEDVEILSELKYNKISKQKNCIGGGRMEAKPAGNETKPAEPQRKTWKDYIGWAGFVVTAGILLQQIYIHGTGLWYICFDPSVPLTNIFSDPKYTLLYRITTVFDIFTYTFFSFFTLAALVLMVLRKKVVPRLLTIFALVAICTNTAMEVLYNLLAAQYNNPVYVSYMTVVYLAIDIALVFFYSKSKRFKSLFIK